MAATEFISIAEVKAFSDPGNTVTDVSSDAVVTATIGAVCEAVEEYLRRPVVARSLSKRSDGGGRHIFLKHMSPGYLSVTSAVEDGKTLVSGTDYLVYEDEGYVARVSGSAFTDWAKGPQIVTIIYTAGVAQTVSGVPENVKLAAKIGVKHFLRLGPDDYGSKLESGAWIKPDKFPRQALWLLDAYRLPGGAA